MPITNQHGSAGGNELQHAQAPPRLSPRSHNRHAIDRENILRTVPINLMIVLLQYAIFNRAILTPFSSTNAPILFMFLFPLIFVPAWRPWPPVDA